MSEPGDFIGQGESRTITPADGSQFTAMSSQDNREIAVSVFPVAGNFWHLHMAAPVGQQLVPGVYEGATRWPFQATTEPGLDFTGDGRGCNTSTGRFEVLEAVYGPLGYVERFHATFEQHCEGAPPALFGEVQIVNPPAPPALTVALAIDRNGTAKRVTGVAAVGGTVACSEPTSVTLFGTLVQRVSRLALATGSFDVSMACSDTPAPWAVQVTPAGDVPFNQGPAQLDVRADAIDPNFGVLVTDQETGLIRLKKVRR